MDSLLTVAAAIGVLVVLGRLGRAVLVVLRWAADGVFARETASTKARRGDLTGLAEAEARAAGARRERRRALVRGTLWAALLIIPTFLPGTRWVYAAYAGLWAVMRGWEQHRGRE